MILGIVLLSFLVHACAWRLSAQAQSANESWPSGPKAARQAPLQAMILLCVLCNLDGEEEPWPADGLHCKFYTGPP